MRGLLNLIPCKRTLVSTTNILWNSYYPLVKSSVLTWIPRNEAVLYFVKLFHLSRWLTNLSWCFSFAVTSRRHISLFRQIHSSFPCRSCWLLHGKIVIFAISDKFANIFSSLPLLLLRAFLGISKSLVTTNSQFSEKQLSKLIFPDRHVSCTNLQSGEKAFFPDWHFSCPHLQNNEKFDSRELLTYCKFSFRCFDFVLLKKFSGK